MCVVRQISAACRIEYEIENDQTVVGKAPNLSFFVDLINFLSGIN